jgi:segregation and condensation protein B
MLTSAACIGNGLPGPAPDVRRGESEWQRSWRRRKQLAIQVSRARTPTTARSTRLARLEAALFVADRPLPARLLAQFAMLADAADVKQGVAELNAAYAAADAAFRIELLATGYQLLTRPEFAMWLDRVHQRHARLKLSPPAMETLAIVAYRQPLTRADVEAVRGVQAGEMLKQLMERGLVRIVGEHDSLGRPFLYGTTREFLELFGLSSTDDLPDVSGLRQSDAQPRSTDETATQAAAAA